MLYRQGRILLTYDVDLLKTPPSFGGIFQKCLQSLRIVFDGCKLAVPNIPQCLKQLYEQDIKNMKYYRNIEEL